MLKRKESNRISPPNVVREMKFAWNHLKDQFKLMKIIMHIAQIEKERERDQNMNM